MADNAGVRAPEPRLLDQVRQQIRLKHYSPRTEEAYVGRIPRFILYSGKRHPRDMGEPEVTRFLSSLAVRGVSASTQNQALSAILFLYDAVLGRRVKGMDGIVRAQRSARLPVVLSRHEVSVLLARLRGPVWLMASLMYGAGLRLFECVELGQRHPRRSRRAIGGNRGTVNFGELPMRNGSGCSYVGYVAMAGGAMGLLLAPVMVIIKYMTGWDIIPEPIWVGAAQKMLGGLLRFATPPGLWMAYGSVYTLALLLMLVGFVGLSRQSRDAQGRLHTKGYWIVFMGLCLVIPGDTVHTWTWHQHGLTTPTPGTNPVANTAYAVHMMGMNFVMAGAMTVGISALRRRFLAPWLAWTFVLIFPSAVVASTTVLPTTPSGALWLFSLMMIACGYCLAAGKYDRLMAA